MKKSLITILSVLSFTILLSGCASIPEPSEKCTTMVYGLGEYKGTYEYAGTTEGETVTKHSGIKVILKSAETNRKYTIISNSRGELIKTGLPEGLYYIDEISAEYTYNGSNWRTCCKPDKSSPVSEFYLGDGVLNLGHIDINFNYTNNNGGTKWNWGFYDALNYFFDNYPDSMWTKERWTTSTGEVETY